MKQKDIHATSETNSPEENDLLPTLKTSKHPCTDLEIIASYSRTQALADGVLVDATKLAREAGFRYPVALTSAAWHDCVAVSSTDQDHDETGRLWDVLTGFDWPSSRVGTARRFGFVLTWQTSESRSHASSLNVCADPVTMQSLS